MIKRLFGAGSTVAQLKTQLDESARRHRVIAHRVANATTLAGGTFEGALAQANGQTPVDLERDMVELADTQIRFEAAASLLRKTFEQIRTSFRSQS